MIHWAALDLEEGFEGEFWGWYDAEHIPRMLARPGWRRVRRYECLGTAPRFASLYDLDDDLPLEPWISEAPFRDSPFATRGIRNYQGRTWRAIHAAGASDGRAPYINAVTVEVDPAQREAFNRWYDEVHVPEILGCPGWLANRRYESAYGAPEVLAIYDLEDAERPFSSSQWEAAVGWDEHVDHIRGFHGFRVYRLLSDSEA